MGALLADSEAYLFPPHHTIYTHTNTEHDFFLWKKDPLAIPSMAEKEKKPL